MMAKVACLIGSEDLKFSFFNARRRNRLAFEEVRFPGIIQTEFL